MTNTIRLLVVEDQAMIREGLCLILDSLPGFEVCGEAANGHEAVQQALVLRPDVLLMDIRMPELNGFQATQAVKRVLPETRVLILTGHDEVCYQQLSRHFGADGFLLKTSDKATLEQAIRAVLAGGVYPPDAADSCSEAMLPGPVAFDSLTKREQEIFRLVVSGRKNREISDRLHISVKTVEKHRANLMKKLDLHSVAELVRVAVFLDLIQPGDADG